MFDAMPLEEIRDASEAAFARIGHNPDRLQELTDAELTSVALHVKTMRPILEAELVCMCGGQDQANAALQEAIKRPQGKLVKLVRAAKLAMKTHRNPSRGQFAALVLDVQAGCGAVQVEQERRAANRCGRVN